jgi:hypothetical protein
MNFRLFLVMATLSLSFHSARCEVYLLSPFSKGGKIWGSDALGGAKLWTEPIKVNGVSLKMRVMLQRQSLREAFAEFKNRFPKARFRSNAESLLVEIPRLNGMVERIYLIAIKGKEFSTIQFSMELPADIPKNPEWLPDLPLPPGASPLETMVMPNRELEYGVFSTRMSPRAAMSDMTGAMLAKGWIEIQKGVLASKDKKRIMLFTASENDKGVTTGFVLSRPLLGENIQ